MSLQQTLKYYQILKPEPAVAFLLIVCMLFSGCGTSSSSQEKRVGINGEAVYVFNKDGSLKCLFKPEHSVHAYTVLLQRDTVTLGDTFSSLIQATAEEYRVVIDSPGKKEILVTEEEKNARYKFIPKREGVYVYRGTIYFDSAHADFEYRFLVVGKKGNNSDHLKNATDEIF